MVRTEKGHVKKIELEDYHDLYEDYSELALDKYANKSATQERRRKGVRYYLQWCSENDVDPVSAGEDDIKQYIRYMMGDMSDTALASRYSSVSMFYEFLVNFGSGDGYSLDENPTADVSIENPPFDLQPQSPEYVKVLRREGKENVKALPKERIEQLFGNGGEPEIRNELILRLFWQTGLRADELSRVKVDNIDLRNREIRIRSAKLNPQDHPALYHRYVYYQSNLDELMETWINHGRPGLSPYADDSPYLMLSHQSEQLNPGTLSDVVKEAAHRAGIQEPMYEDAKGDTRWLVTAHRIRHSAISYWANELGMNITSIRRMAGHAKLETTKNYITTSWDEVARDYRHSINQQSD